MIYRITYSTKENLFSALESRGILITNEEGGSQLGEGIHSVDYIGRIPDVLGTTDEDGNELTPTTYVSGYHCNISSERKLTFGANLVQPSTPFRKFAGEE
jgi:hypothetical protein